jgi:hypothetical protein
MKAKYIDSEKAVITVTSYRDTGKCYTTHTCELKPEHEALEGFELIDLFRDNDPSVRDYTGLSCGVTGFIFAINVLYLSEENRTKYCHRLIFGEGWDK